ncbi:MAG: ergothioneine biosynthesis protein EgtB [Acidiphilium sp.]|nr:ergothioneine biosynthesis protein EgtB [Acidiphilium sp.]MDD4935754.1 ergothioneine biosynthesis protein EgtB [Acidiphilium sp.]
MDAFQNNVATRQFSAVRDYTEYLSSALSAEDQCVQSMDDASPVKWHRAHTTWFFEHFVLVPHVPNYRIFDPSFQFLFNSYYESVGERHPRPQRGLITRPTCDHVGAYRAHVDAAMIELIGEQRGNLAHLIELGLQHEEQHQELLVTDITHAFAQNKLLPAAIPHFRRPRPLRGETKFVAFDGGMAGIGHSGDGFYFDNEAPHHRVYLEPYRLTNRLVCNREFLDFMTDGGYRTSTLWMADGWAAAQARNWSSPCYWRKRDGLWHEFGPEGLRPLDPEAPVAHISWYEADAFARWAWARLPTEAEWEAASDDARLFDMNGQVWQWTASAYAPYPGFRPVSGAIGEYNGKFMINQMVLRGSSMATSPGHARVSYRNFFHPDKRWQFAGLRLAQDC